MRYGKNTERNIKRLTISMSILVALVLVLWTDCLVYGFTNTKQENEPMTAKAEYTTANTKQAKNHTETLAKSINYILSDDEIWDSFIDGNGNTVRVIRPKEGSALEAAVETSDFKLERTLVEYSAQPDENKNSSGSSRESIISSKKDCFKLNKTLKESDIKVVEPHYNSDNKLVIGSRAEAVCLDIRTRSNWTEDDFYTVLNDEMKELVPTAIRLENELGVNALYIIAVGANETGWGKYMAGNHNYFNWTNDAIYHFDFDNAQSFSDFSVKTYNKYYIHEDFYSGKLGFTPKHITPEVVNVKYALNPNGKTNWQWTNTVCDIMGELSAKRFGK